MGIGTQLATVSHAGFAPGLGAACNLQKRAVGFLRRLRDDVDESINGVHAPERGPVLTGHIVNRIDRGHGEHISGEEDVLVEDVLYALGRNQHHDRENEIHQ